ncbi:helix-turn-helix transcriptional regulator [Blautia producta]|nr:helix-turn-helix transcriptional regulator [Blautia producta]NSG15241.1 helix-turn-helix transcriptional regulator [Blautia producta]NSJ75434.1 helix-turn-helix transcriptional regulator [Blautia producta]
MGSRALSQGLIEIGERIRKRRQELRWPQEKLAEMADVSLNTVSRVEGGQSDMSIEVFKRLAQALGMSASELLGDVEFLEGDGQVQRLLYRVRHLKRGDKEVVLRTVDALIDAIHCREE